MFRNDSHGRAAAIGAFMFAAPAIAASIGANDSPTVRDFMLDICANIDDRGCQIFIVSVKNAYEAGYHRGKMGDQIFAVTPPHREYCVGPMDSAKTLAAMAKMYFGDRPGFWDQPAIAYLITAWGKQAPCR